MNLIERAKQFKEGAQTIMDWLGAGAQKVHPTLAQSRADVCLRCPLNVKQSAMTEAMADAVKKQVEIKNRLQLRVKGEKSLLSCAACGCVTRLKIWLPIENILPEDQERHKFDPECWIFKEIGQ